MRWRKRSIAGAICWPSCGSLTTSKSAINPCFASAGVIVVAQVNTGLTGGNTGVFATNITNNQTNPAFLIGVTGTASGATLIGEVFHDAGISLLAQQTIGDYILGTPQTHLFIYDISLPEAAILEVDNRDVFDLDFGDGSDPSTEDAASILRFGGVHTPPITIPLNGRLYSMVFFADTLDEKTYRGVAEFLAISAGFST